MKILITGGCGFVGANLALFLYSKGFNINTLDNLSRKGSKYNLSLLKKKKIKNYNFDIANYNKFKKLPKYDFIIDCCAEPAVEISRKEINKVINTNLIGTLNVLKKVKKDNSKIIFLSSSRVYPIKDLNKILRKKIIKSKIKVDKMFCEKDNIEGPKTIYGLTKLTSEMLIEEFSYAFGIKYIINRCGVISGPLQFGKQDQGFLSLWIWSHLNKKKIKYIGYGGFGNQIRDVLHIYDLCSLILIQIKKINKITNKLFTVGGSKKSYTSLKQLTNICEKITKNKLKLQKIPKTSIYDIPYFITDNKLVTKTFGWKPKRDIFEVVNDTYLWLKNNKIKIKKIFLMSLALITGSTGLVGSEAVNFFHDKGFDVIGIDNNLRKFFFGKNGSTSWIRAKLLKRNKNFQNFNVDIRNKLALKKIFRKYSGKISIIIHCAAQPSHDYGKNYPFLDFHVNATGTLNLLELTKIYSPDSPFIFMSTNKVYGDNPNKLKIYEKKTRWELKKDDKNFRGIKENFSLDNATHSFFGVSKTYADLIVQEYGKNVGLKTVCFRGGCITGPNHSGATLHGFLSYLVKASLNNRRYNLIGYKGKQVRDNLHSNDLVSCFWEFYKKPRKGEVYNIGGGRYSNCSILEALNLVEETSNIKIKKNILKTPRVGDHIWYISDTSRFKKHYPKWKQKYNTKKIIEELIENQK